MTLPSLIRLAALSSILAGAMRTVASFIPYTSDSVPLELLYLVIDISLLFAMIGIYAREHAQTGITGFSGFVLAVAGAASIVGPDGTLGGVDLYSAGALLISLGLVLWGVASWRAGTLPRAVPVLWIASSVLGVGGFALTDSGIPFLIAGVMFGAAFLIAGLRLLAVRTLNSPSPAA